MRHYRLLFIAVIVLTIAACSDKQPTVTGTADGGSLDLITASAIEAHVRWLADDAREGRMTGEPGYDAAAQYVADRFAELDMVPAGDEGWLQQVPLVSYKIDTDSTSVIAYRDGSEQLLEYREHYGMFADKVRSENSVRGEVVYAGFGVHAPDNGYSDYDGVDVQGKIVAVFDGAPRTFSHAQRAYYASGRTKAEEGIRRGAIGFIGLRSQLAQKRTPWERYKKMTGKRPGMAWVSLSGEASDYFPELRGAIVISRDAATELLTGTPISFEEALDATEASTPASTPLGFDVLLSRHSEHERISSPNVIGLVRGTDPMLADEYVVYSAHLDHTGHATAPETDDDINNGAYDNAMGVAIMLETARAIAANPPARSVLFIALTAEERGLLGSDYFAHYPTVPGNSIVANINVDMPLFLYPVADLIAFGAEHSSLQSAVAAAAQAEGFALTPNPLPEENLFVRSDQYSFVRRGVPSIYLVPGFTSSDPDIDGEAAFRDHVQNHYHEPSDDMSRPFHWDSVVRFTRAKTRIGYRIANENERPSWNSGDFFGARFASGER